MAQRELKTTIILRNDTAENWASAQPTLSKGEIGLEIDTAKYKIGNGVDKWASLPYYNHIDDGSKTSLDTLIEMLTNDQFGKVDDVKVNGTSVLGTDKVAGITVATINYSADAQTTASDDLTATSVTLHKVAKTGNYADLIGVPDAIEIVDNLDSESTTSALSANQGHSLKQMIQQLPTGKSYATISALVTALNGASAGSFNVGSNLYIEQLNVPDFWVAKTNTTSVAYTYTTDDALVNAIKTSGSVQIGYYSISILETAKVDLTDYATIKYVGDNFVSNEILTQKLSELKNQVALDGMGFEPTAAKLTYADGVAKFTGKFSYTTKDAPDTPVQIDGSITLNIKGNSDVVVDADDTNTYLRIKLDESVDTRIEALEDAVADETILRSTDTFIINGGTSEV